MKNIRYFFEYILIIILFGILLSSCEKDSDTQNNIFKYNEYSNISSLDPAFSSTLRNIWPVNQIFNGLVQLDKNLGMIFVNNHAIAVAIPMVIHLHFSRESTFLYNNDMSDDTLVSVLSIISVHLS